MTDLARAEHLLELGIPAEAERLARAALVSDPQSPLALELLGRALQQLGRPYEAERSLRAALAVEPGSGSSAVALSEVLLEQGRQDDAVWIAWRTIEGSPHWWVAHYQYARCLLAADPPTWFEAQHAAREATRLAPNNPDAHNLLGMALDEGGSRAEARAAYQRALEINPDHAHALNNLAVLDNSVLRIGHATRALRQALVLDPTDPVFRANLGVLLGQLTFRILLLMGCCGAALGVLLAVGTPPQWRALVGLVLLTLVLLVGWTSLRLLPRGLLSSPRELLSRAPTRSIILIAALLPLGFLVCVMAFGSQDAGKAVGALLLLCVRILGAIGIVSLVVRGLGRRGGGQGR